MSFVHDSIAQAGSIGIGFSNVGTGILAYVLTIVIVLLALLGIIELCRIPLDLHRRRIRKEEKARKKQEEKDRKAMEKARKKGEPVPPPPEEHHEEHHGEPPVG